MIQSIHREEMHCQCTTLVGTEKIIYILAPLQIPTEDMHSWAEKLKANIAIVYGMDWDNDLTPWPAPGQPKSCPPFEGNAPKFYKYLISEVIPTVEKAIGYATTPRRTIVGISLSGLFALWAWAKYDFFSNICSISGSFWYEGFVDWMQSLDLNGKPGRVYFSLGVEEPHSRQQVFATVGSATEQIIEILKSEGINPTFEWNPGDHYAPITPRLEKVFAFLSK